MSAAALRWVRHPRHARFEPAAYGAAELQRVHPILLRRSLLLASGTALFLALTLRLWLGRGLGHGAHWPPARAAAPSPAFGRGPASRRSSCSASRSAVISSSRSPPITSGRR